MDPDRGPVMYAVATCEGPTYRGTTTDEVGDVVDTNTSPYLARVLARVEVRTVRVQDSTTQTPTTVRRPVARMQSDTDIAAGDRYRCTRHGVLYAVLSATQATRSGREDDLIVELQEVIPAE
ncbi:MAG: hypothetical protein HOV68_32140 [Streptomycetaceae bacterium]|nr:hypothetical protein [Streptomycetaceae bacterium]